jgi:hypothetical protein
VCGCHYHSRPMGELRTDLFVFRPTNNVKHEKKAETLQPTQFFAPYLPPPYPAPWAVRPGHTSDEVSMTSTMAPGTFIGPQRTAQPDSVSWPLTFQLTLLGRSRGLQYPTDITLAEALNARDKDRARGGGAGDRYMAQVRMRGVEGRLGSRQGVEWGFGVGTEGLEVFADQSEG